MKFYIKNMVCDRCILVVRQELEKLDIKTHYVILGEVETTSELLAGKIQQLDKQLINRGFELLDNTKQQLIEKIKNIVIEHIHYNNDEKQYNFSGILSKKLHKDYSYLSNLFSTVAGITIEKYIINQRIEKAKELIIYDELNLSEIAVKLGYSSLAHLSSQFKKITGLSPTHFKQVGQLKRKPLDKI